MCWPDGTRAWDLELHVKGDLQPSTTLAYQYVAICHYTTNYTLNRNNNTKKYGQKYCKLNVQYYEAQRGTVPTLVKSKAVCIFPKEPSGFLPIRMTRTVLALNRFMMKALQTHMFNCYPHVNTRQHYHLVRNHLV